MATITAARPRANGRKPALTELPGIVVGSSMPEDYVLGRQAMYSLPDDPRSGPELLRSWQAHGLDPDRLPDARQKVDVFRSACASVQDRTATNHRGQRIQILANEVRNVPKECSYQITIRRWAGDVIEHDKTMTVNFDKRTNAISVTKLDAFDAEWAKIQTAIQEHFDANGTTVPGQKIRNAIRQQLIDVGGQNLRRKAGGVYFVPKATPTGEPTLPVLEGIANVLADLYGDRADFDVIKWANDEGEREIVRKHFALNANEKARELSEKAWARVRQGRGERGVRSDLIANLENERRVLLGHVRQFEQLVELEESDVKESIGELDEALEKLNDLANEPPAPK